MVKNHSATLQSKQDAVTALLVRFKMLKKAQGNSTEPATALGAKAKKEKTVSDTDSDTDSDSNSDLLL